VRIRRTRLSTETLLKSVDNFPRKPLTAVGRSAHNRPVTKISRKEVKEMEIQEVMAEATIMHFFSDVMSEDWRKMEVADQVAFRDALEAFVSGANLLRERFDAQVWSGHSDGTVDTTVKSIRAQRTGDKPGKKAAELTPAEILAKRLSK
jgi:hypothetical protein